MTSRTTPVGILVIALASIIAVGCSASTDAVFQALVDPAGTAVSSPEAVATDDATPDVAGSSWRPHPDGYEMNLPAGWTGVAVERDQSDELISAIDDSLPGLADRMEGVLVGSRIRVSAIATDLTAEGRIAPLLIVLAQPTEGRRPHALKIAVRDQIAALPGITDGPPSMFNVDLPKAKAVRFSYRIEDEDLGELWVTSYLVRFGTKEAYLVSFLASDDVAGDTDDLFDEIAESLRFGV